MKEHSYLQNISALLTTMILKNLLTKHANSRLVTHEH